MLLRKTPTNHEDLRVIGDRRRLNGPVKPFIEHLVIRHLSKILSVASGLFHSAE